MKFARDLMATFPETLGPEDTIRSAARLMRDNDLTAIPIVDSRDVDDSGVVVGIVTDRDIVLKAIAYGHGVDTPIKTCMSANPDGAAPDTPISEVKLLMTAKNIRHIPVLEFGRLLGMVTAEDIENAERP